MLESLYHQFLPEVAEQKGIVYAILWEYLIECHRRNIEALLMKDIRGKFFYLSEYSLLKAIKLMLPKGVVIRQGSVLEDGVIDRYYEISLSGMI